MREPNKLADILQETADNIDKLKLWERVNISWLQNVHAPILREAADTIRAERTCTVVGSHTFGERDELKAYALSCGHELEWNDTEPPSFCPECGARVVESDEA